LVVDLSPLTPLSSEIGAQTRRIGTYRQFLFLRRMVMAVLILNLLDGILTLVWITTGVAEEANPLLADLVNEQPILFMGAKTALVGLGSLLLWWRRKRPMAVVAIFICFVVYYLLLLYHLSSMQLNLLTRWF
jgi:hypothetical protein